MASAAYAYPSPSEAAGDERDQRVNLVVASGAGGQAWREYFHAAEQEWLRLDNERGLGGVFAPWDCYELGCFTTVTLPSVEDFERFNQLARDSSTVRGWAGAGFVSGPVPNELGEIEVTWIFFAPPT
jgi:hypothetical protein